MQTTARHGPNLHQPEPQTAIAAIANSLSESQTNAPRGANGNGPAQDLECDRATAPLSGKSVLILYGTVSGNAETLANKTATTLRHAGIVARVRDMAHCQPNVLTQANCVLIVVSTHGDGEPPDDAAPFWETVLHSTSLDLRGLRFSVLALGNATFDHFCKCGRDFDAALERHGARRIYPRIDCDVDYDAPAKLWLDRVLAQLLGDERSALSAQT